MEIIDIFAEMWLRSLQVSAQDGISSHSSRQPECSVFVIENTNLNKVQKNPALFLCEKYFTFKEKKCGLLVPVMKMTRSQKQ